MGAEGISNGQVWYAWTAHLGFIGMGTRGAAR